MLKDYFSLAFGNLRHRGLRSWLTVLGIFIGIAAVVSLISMGQGLETAITAQFGSLPTDVLRIENKGAGFGPPGSTAVERLNDHDIKILESVQGVDLVVPRIIEVGQLEYNKISGFGFGIDIPEEREEREFVYNFMNAEAEEGRLLESGDSGKILLGSHFFETDDFEKPFEIGKNVKINGKSFGIIGFLKPSSSLQFNSMVFMMDDDMEELFDTKGGYGLLTVQVKDKDRIEEVAEEIEFRLRNDRKEDVGEESFNVQTPLQALSSVNSILDIINLIVIGIASISLFVGGVGISNTMYTSIVERTREIGIMKAVGGKNKDVLMIFLIESGLLGLVGGIIGAIMGMAGALGISYMANQAVGENVLAVTISFPLLIGAVSFSFFVGIISGILPAIQASKLNVVDALRS